MIKYFTKTKTVVWTKFTCTSCGRTEINEGEFSLADLAYGWTNVHFSYRVSCSMSSLY